MALIQGNDNRNGLDGTRFADVILGYGGDDQIFGNDGGDSLFGGTGADSVFGNAGWDFLDGGRGSDDLFGGEGADILFGGLGTENDFLYGGNSSDSLYGGAGFDFLNGGSGRDLIVGVNPGGGFTSSVGYNWSLRGVTVNLASRFAIDEFGFRDRLINILDVDATNLNDKITGDARDNFFTPYAGADILFGGAGVDEVNYNTGGPRAVFVNLANGVATDNYGNRDRLAGIEMVRGTDRDDQIIGNSANNIFRGLDGDDVQFGGKGYDEVWYDRDFDFGGFRGVNVNLAAGFARDGFGTIDSLFQIEGVKGTQAADRLTGNSSTNTLDGGFGNDSLYGAGGQDMLFGGQGRDILNGGGGWDTVSYLGDAEDGGTLGVSVNLATGRGTDGFGSSDQIVQVEHVQGTQAADKLTGSSANNRLLGEGGSDTLFGLAGNDRLNGGSGNDQLSGQAGRDTFEFDDRWGRTVITDFKDAINEKLDFSANDAINSVSDLTLTQVGANTRIDADEGTIILQNVQMGDLSAANYLF